LFGQQAFQAAGKLDDYPMMGRMVPEIGQDSIREVIG
jgi:hypothetical protein